MRQRVPAGHLGGAEAAKQVGRAILGLAIARRHRPDRFARQMGIDNTLAKINRTGSRHASRFPSPVDSWNRMSTTMETPKIHLMTDTLQLMSRLAWQARSEVASVCRTALAWSLNATDCGTITGTRVRFGGLNEALRNSAGLGRSSSDRTTLDYMTRQMALFDTRV